MSSPYVTMKIKDEQRLISIEVRLAFYPHPQVAADKWSATLKSLPAVIKAVETKWSRLKYMCYDVKLKIVHRWVATAADADPDELDVMLDNYGMGPAGFDAHTRSRGPSTIWGGIDYSKALSEAPADQVVPLRSDAKATSAWPAAPGTMSHEVGHVMGLDEGYILGSDTHEAVPGHPDDVMRDPQLPVLPSTITRLIRREFGPTVDSRLHCPISLKAGPSSANLVLASIGDVAFTASAPNYPPPSADPASKHEPAHFRGTFSAKGEYLKQILPKSKLSASGELTVDVAFDVDLSQTPTEMRIDLGFWILRQTVRWDEHTNLPYVIGPLIAEAPKTGGRWSSEEWAPGPPLFVRFWDPDRLPAPK